MIPFLFGHRSFGTVRKVWFGLQNGPCDHPQTGTRLGLLLAGEWVCYLVGK